MASHGLTIDSVLGFSNAELVDKLYSTIGVVSDDLDEVADALYYLVDELVERFAPDEARAERLRSNLGAKDLQASLDALRQKQAARMLCDALN
jgi:hypothetical protein